MSHDNSVHSAPDTLTSSREVIENNDSSSSDDSFLQYSPFLLSHPSTNQVEERTTCSYLVSKIDSEVDLSFPSSCPPKKFDSDKSKITSESIPKTSSSVSGSAYTTSTYSETKLTPAEESYQAKRDLLRAIRCYCEAKDDSNIHREWCIRKGLPSHYSPTPSEDESLTAEIESSTP